MGRQAHHVLLFILLFPLVAVALEIPPEPTGYVSDWAGALSQQAKQELDETLRQFELSTTNQVLVAIFQSLEGEEMAGFTIAASEKWKVGQKGRDNGVILFIFLNDRELRIEVGYGLEGALPDALADLIIQQEIVPYFRAGRFDEGVTKGVSAIIKTISGEYAPSEKPRREMTEVELQQLREKWAGIFRIVAAMLGAAILADFFRYGRYRRGHKNYKERFGFWGWWFNFAILFFVLNLVFRIGLQMLLSGRGGYHGSRSGYGGFSGGGGSFGGGGASGRW
ncbi:MAG: TPM domain-containing protein [Deltaproteobacteria bacterium]|nr:TPM domain-containing protein [Deltaproteobacteria bacterium]